MNSQQQNRATVTSTRQSTLSPACAGLLQRKCACGGAAGLTGKCAECSGKRLTARPPLIQTKLTIGEPGERYEQEADRVAEQVMRMPGPDREEQVEEIGRMPARGDQLRRQPVEEEEEEEELLQAKEISGRPPALSPDLEARVQALRGGGQPLPDATRAFFEPRFGHDFGRVRVHTDARAAATARAVNASAFTVGRDIVFATERYAPETPEGRKLLGHELTHVVQQSRASSPSSPAPARVGIGRPTRSHAAVLPAIQRQKKPEPPKFPELDRLILELTRNVGENLHNYGHHFYRISSLHPDEPELLEQALSRYALGLNTLETTYMFFGSDRDTAHTLALGTGILFKGLTYASEGELVLDYQIDLASGWKLETSIDLAVDPSKFLRTSTDVKKAEVNVGLIGRF